MKRPSPPSHHELRFPFSDLTASKLRPAIILANVGRGEYILVQVTSNPYGDDLAVESGRAYDLCLYDTNILSEASENTQGEFRGPVSQYPSTVLWKRLSRAACRSSLGERLRVPRG